MYFYFKIVIIIIIIIIIIITITIIIIIKLYFLKTNSPCLSINCTYAELLQYVIQVFMGIVTLIANLHALGYMYNIQLGAGRCQNILRYKCSETKQE